MVLPKHSGILALLITVLLTSECLVSAKAVQDKHLHKRISSDKGKALHKRIDAAELLKKGDVTLNNCDLSEKCDDGIDLGTDPHKDSYGENTDGSAQWSSLGLRSSNLHVNRIAVGFVPAFNEKKSPNSPADINAKLPKPMSIVGDYVEIDDTLSNLGWHVPTIKKLEGNPVWCIGLMPTKGLESITWEVADKIAKKLKHINDQGITVWLRFGHEMNGEWYCWGMKPELFKEKWNLLGERVKATTSMTYMLWSPNAIFGDSIDSLKGGYTKYWPGSKYVDIAGLSFYHWGKSYHRLNIAPDQDEVVGKIHEFNKLYGDGGEGKPIVIAETAASYTYNQWTKAPVEGGASELDIKMKWAHLLLDRYIKKVVPNLRAMIWFEIIKDENATGDTPVRTEDFRLIVGNRQVSSAAAEFFKNSV